MSATPGRSGYLQDAPAKRGWLFRFLMYYGPEFVSLALDLWAYRHGGQLHFIDPGRPTRNAYIESFHRRFRDECLSAHWFESLPDARILIDRWRQDYNNARPHTSLGASPSPRRPNSSKDQEPHEPPLTRLSA